MSAFNLDALCADALARLRAGINRSAGQHRRQMARVSEGTASAQRINAVPDLLFIGPDGQVVSDSYVAAPLPVRCPFHPDLCNWPEGECAGLCSLKRPQP